MISRVNANVPAHKPETFWEAMQYVVTIQHLLLCEENQTGLSIGRVDQYMYPLYKRDIEAGRMNDYQAFELAGCMFIKMSEMMWLTSEGSSKFLRDINHSLTCVWVVLLVKDVMQQMT